MSGKKLTKRWTHVQENKHLDSKTPTVPMIENKLFGAGFRNRENACTVEVALELLTHMATQTSILSLFPNRLREILNTRHAGNDNSLRDLHQSCSTFVGKHVKWGKYGAFDDMLLGCFREHLDVITSLHPIVKNHKVGDPIGMSALLEPWQPRHAPWMILESQSASDSKLLSQAISTDCFCKAIVWHGAFYQCIAIVRAVESTSFSASASASATSTLASAANHFILDLASRGPDSKVAWFRYDSLYVAAENSNVSKYQLLNLADPLQWNTESIVALVLLRLHEGGTTHGELLE